MAKSLCCPPGTITTLLTGYQFSSVELLSRAYLSPHRLQHTRLPCPSPTAGACSNSCPSSCFIDYVNIIQPSHPLLSPSPPAFREKEHPQASESFPISQFFASGGQSIGASVSASVLPMNIQDWFPLGWTGLISSLRNSQKSSPTPQYKSINFSVLSFLYGPIHIHTWLLEKP